MVQSPEEEDSGFDVLDNVVGYTDLFGGFVDVRQELALGQGSVGAELVENLGEGGLRHGDLAEMVEKGDLLKSVSVFDKSPHRRTKSYYAVVSTTLAAELQRLFIEATLVDNPIREHGLGPNPEDEHPETKILVGL